MTIDSHPGKVSRLLDYLPALFQLDSEPGQPNFAGRFLLAFERILLGLGKISPEIPEPGLEEILAGGQIKIRDNSDRERTVSLKGIERYFEPGYLESEARLVEEHQRTPSDFLPWLASWLALTLREDWDDLRQAELIAKAAQLYRLRGTKQGLEEFLRIYTRLGVQIDEPVDTPFFFQVHVLLPTRDPNLLKQQTEISRAIIEMQKPAHTYYELFVDTQTLQIGFHSTVGRDTLIR